MQATHMPVAHFQPSLHQHKAPSGKEAAFSPGSASRSQHQGSSPSKGSKKGTRRGSGVGTRGNDNGAGLGHLEDRRAEQHDPASSANGGTDLSGMQDWAERAMYAQQAGRYGAPTAHIPYGTVSMQVPHDTQPRHLVSRATGREQGGRALET